jgi:predicted transcriptional regulator
VSRNLYIGRFGLKYIVKALLNLASFIELSAEGVIAEDTAVKALEQLVADLSEAEPSEIEYLKACVNQEIVEVGDGRTRQQQDRIEFLLNLIEDIGQ